MVNNFIRLLDNNGGEHLIRGILFDKDDTLLDLAKMWREPLVKIAKHLLFLCGEESEEALLCLMGACGFDGDMLIPESPVVTGTNEDIFAAWLAKMDELGLPAPNDEIMKEARRHYRENVNAADCIEPVEECTAGVLRELKARGLKLGVATSDVYETTCICLKRLGVFDCFDMILSADRVASPKPDPDGAIKFAEYYNLPLDQIAMVGDSQNDMRFAANSGIHGIYYDRRFRTGRLPEGAERSIVTMRELIDG